MVTDELESASEAAETVSAVDSEDTPTAKKKQSKPRQKGPKEFPTPPRGSGKAGNVDPDKFFAYWHKLPAEFADRLIVYIQREWPVYDYTLGYYNQAGVFCPFTPEQKQEISKNPQKLRKYSAKYETKYSERWDTDDWQYELLRRHGTGDFKLFLNDSGVSGQIHSANVLKTFVQVRDKEHPPILDRPELLDLSDPANASYIESLRMRGVALPGDVVEVGESEDEMANTAALEKLTDTVVELSRERNKPAASVPPDDSRVAANETLKVMSSAAIEGQRIVTDAIKTAQAMTARTSDPMEHTKSVIEMARVIADRPRESDGGGMVAMFQEMLRGERERGTAMLAAQQQMFTMIFQQTEARMALLENELKAARTPPTTASNGGPIVTGAADGEFKILDKLLGIKDKLDKLTGGGEDAGGGMPAWAPMVLEGGKMLLSAAANITHNLAVMRTGQGQPAPMPEVAAELPEPEQTQEEDMTLNPKKQYLNALREPLLRALAGGNHGYELAGLIINQFGSMSYDMLQGMGQAGIVSLLSEADYWGEVSAFGNQRVSTFLLEFLDTHMAQRAADTIRAASARSAAQPKAQPVPAPASMQPGRSVVDPATGRKVETVHAGPVVVPKGE